MLDRFINYRLTPADYVPNNICESNRIPPQPKPPLVAYNKAGEPIGFTWNYGDTIYLEFTTTGYVTYDEGDTKIKSAFFTEDAKTYLESKTPSDYPKYNDNGIRLRTDDVKKEDEDSSVEESDTSTSDAQETEETVTADEYFEDGTKVFQFLVYNFRYDVVAWCETPAKEVVRILSDSFYPCSLVKGTYKLKMNLIDKNAGTQCTLIDTDECTLFIK